MKRSETVERLVAVALALAVTKRGEEKRSSRSRRDLHPAVTSTPFKPRHPSIR